jgi:hypothetical protein
MRSVHDLTPVPPSATRRSVAVVIPFDARSDEHRIRAHEWIVDHYGVHHPEWPVFSGSVELDEWSKGAAVDELVRRADADVLVIADADSYVTSPAVLVECVRKVAFGDAGWSVPHTYVHRLTEGATAEVYAGRAPRMGKLTRAAYVGPAGGGIVVVSRRSYGLVHGIDPRFLGWGGEDLAFGWALDTLVGPHYRGDSRLVHLWHPHPAPDLRGSDESEALVADYREARGFPRMMLELVNRRPLPPPAVLEQPVRFRIVSPYRNVVKVPGRRPLRFVSGELAVDDADLVDALRRSPDVREVTP